MDACWKLPLLRQSWTTLGILIGLIASGMSVGYSSSLMAALQAPNTPVTVDLQAASWLASVLGPSYLSGQLLSAFFMDWIGRRQTLLLTSLPNITGWILIYFAMSYNLLLIGRILNGIGVGYMAYLGAIVIGEYTSPKYRGVFLNLKMASYNLGSTIAHVLDGYADWRTIALICIVPNVTSFLIICTLPESPSWLVSRKKYDKCREDFSWLRGRSESAVLEVEELIAAQKERQRTIYRILPISEKVTIFFKKFAERDFLRCLLVFSFSLLLLETAGRHFFAAYAVKIMSDIAGTKTGQRNYTLILDLLLTMSSFASVLLVKTMKRRTLLFASGISALFILLPACTSLYLLSNGILPRDYQIVPICLLIIYFMLINLGGVPVTAALKGELFPLRHKSGGTIAAAFIHFLIMTGLMHATPFLLLYVKVHGTFALFGMIMALALMVLYFTLPEMKDRTLQELDDYFQNGRFVGRRLHNEDLNLKMIDTNGKQHVSR